MWSFTNSCVHVMQSLDVNTTISKRPHTQCNKKNLQLHLLRILILFIYYNIIFSFYLDYGISAYYLNIDSTDPFNNMVASF
jgi:hypothetical protein